MKILVTGGCGYIGSHTVVKLLEEKFEVVIIDNLVNSKREVLDKIKKITGSDVTFYQEDLCNLDALKNIFKKEKFDAIIHFAGLKAVGESVQIPLKYYQNNLISTMNLLFCMQEYGVKKLVFSSSATVYGNPKSLPIKEDFPLHTTNPYGTTKLMIEQILKDVYQSNPDFDITILFPSLSAFAAITSETSMLSIATLFPAETPFPLTTSLEISYSSTLIFAISLANSSLCAFPLIVLI